MLRVPLLKIKNACVNQLYAETNLELTSPYSVFTKPKLLYLHRRHRNTADAKQAKNSTHNNSRQDYFSKHHQNSVYGGLRLLQVYGDVNRTAWEEVFLWKSSSLHFALESWPFHVKEFLPTVFQHSKGSHSFFLPVGSLFQVNKHY